MLNHNVPSTTTRTLEYSMAVSCLLGSTKMSVYALSRGKVSVISRLVTDTLDVLLEHSRDALSVKIITLGPRIEHPFSRRHGRCVRKLCH